MRCSQFPMVVFLVALFAALSAGGDQINIVVGANAPRLEKFAAMEMADQFEQLFDAEVLVTELPEVRESTHRVLIGGPATNQLIKTACVDRWPELTDQGICVRSIADRDQPTIVVGGGSPVATMWAAYELGHHFGIRYMLHGDIFPPEKIPLQLDELDIVMEPQFRNRAWETLGPFACGQAAWTLAEQRRALGQLAKLKYNRVVLAFAPWQPFVHYEFRGVPKSSARLWHGGPFRVDGDTVGRDVFRGAVAFTHPDFEGRQSYTEITNAGTTLARGIIDAAHELGMSAAIAISPLEFSFEFDKVLPDAVPRGFESLVVGPGHGQSPDDRVLLDLAKKKIRAYLTTYADIDTIYLTLPASSAWTGHHEHAWDMLRADSQIGDETELRELIAGVDGEDEQESLQSGITALACLRQILSDPSLFKKSEQGDIPIVIAGVNSALFAQLDQLNPNNGELLHGINVSARELAAAAASLESVPAGSAKYSSLVLTLHDRNVGPLPQCVLGDIHQLVNVVRGQKWNGFLTRYPLVGASAPVLYYLSRASFDPQMTPERALDQFFTAVSGAGTVAAMTKCYALLEQATDVIYENDPTIALPLPGMLTTHYAAEGPPPEWWKEAKTLYLQSLSEEGRAIERSENRGKPYLLFLIKRLVLGLTHFGTLESLRLSGDARLNEDYEKATEQFEAAIESLHGGTYALASQTRYRSDTGTIAILNAYGYHPMLEELDVLYAAEEEKEE